MSPKTKARLMMSGLKWLNVLVTIGLFVLCWLQFYAHPHGKALYYTETQLVLVFYAVVVVILSKVYGAYFVGSLRITELIYSHMLANTICAGLTYAMSVISEKEFPSVLPMLGLLLMQLVWHAVWSYAANKVYFLTHPPRNTAVIYRNEADLARLDEINFFEARFVVRKYILNPASIPQMLSEIEDYDAVFVLGMDDAHNQAVARRCVEKDIRAFITPCIDEIIMAGAEHLPMFSVPVMRIRRGAPALEYLAIKRITDIAGSLVAAIIASPLMLLTALAIKLYDGGPVFYKQVRLTKDAREFSILKFRSMRMDAEKDGVARLASVGDDRITPVGRVIRACRIDELPQLFNILKGDMTFVGPRPERPEIAKEYEKEIPAFPLRLQVKAGLTGLAQVYGRYNTEPEIKLQMDLMYINRMSLIEDFRLIFATIRILFVKESAQGMGETYHASEARDDRRSA